MNSHELAQKLLSGPDIAIFVAGTLGELFSPEIIPVSTVSTKDGAPGDQALMITPRGICWVCGCDNESPCEGGCSWTDDTETRCIKCDDAQGFPREEVLR